LIARVALDHRFPVVNIAIRAEEGQMCNDVISHWAAWHTRKEKQLAAGETLLNVSPRLTVIELSRVSTVCLRHRECQCLHATVVGIRLSLNVREQQSQGRRSTPMETGDHLLRFC